MMREWTYFSPLCKSATEFWSSIPWRESVAATTPVTENPRFKREFARSTAANEELHVDFSFG